MMLTTEDTEANRRALIALHVDAQTAALTWNALWRAPIVSPVSDGPLYPRALRRSLALIQSTDYLAFTAFQ